MSLYLGTKKIKKLIVGGGGSSSGGGGLLQKKIVVPTEEIQVITPDSGFYGILDVTVSAIPSDYIGTGIPVYNDNGSISLNSTTNTKTFPAGYYSNSHSVTVNKTTYYSPSMSFNAATGVFSVTHNQAEGYVPLSSFSDTISLSTLQGTTITPTESTQSISSNRKYMLGDIVVNPISSSYIGSNIPRLDSNTYTPGTTNQLIPAGRYLIGVQTIQGDPNLKSSNIKAGTSIFGVTGTYVGEETGEDYSGATATQNQILSGYTAYTQSGLVSGTIPTNGVSDITVSGPTVTVSSGYYNTDISKSVTTATQATPTLSRTGNVVTATSTQTTGYVSGGTKSSSLTLPTKATQTYTPTTTDQTISAGSWLGGDQIILGDPNLISSNIASGVSIFGVNGTHQGGGGGIDTSDATATTADILLGKTAYVDGNRITGTIPTKTSANVSISGTNVTIPAGYYATQATKTIPTVELSSPSITTTPGTKDLLIESTITQSAGYTTGDTKTSSTIISAIPGGTYTPGTTLQTINSGVYLLGDIRINGDTNLKASNIRDGVSIFGIRGSYVGEGGIDTSDATAVASDILYGKTAYVNDELVTGTMAINSTLPDISEQKPVIDDTGAIIASYTLPTGYYLGGTKTNCLGILTTKAAQTYTPGTTNQTISSYTWLTGNQTILGDANLIPENIKSGVSIFGVSGTCSGQNRTITIKRYTN